MEKSECGFDGGVSVAESRSTIQTSSGTLAIRLLMIRYFRIELEPSHWLLLLLQEGGGDANKVRGRSK